MLRLTSRNIRDAFNIGTFDSSNSPEEFLCTSNQILDLIHSLDSLKPLHGADGIPTKMLKATASSISKSLSDLFNKFMITGMLPTEMNCISVGLSQRVIGCGECHGTAWVKHSLDKSHLHDSDLTYKSDLVFSALKEGLMPF